VKSRKWIISLSAVLLVALTVVGYMAVGAEYGSKDDPLVSLSYIEEVLAPETMEKIDKALEEKQKEFDAQLEVKLSEAYLSIEEKMQEYENAVLGTEMSDELVKQVTDAVLAQINTTPPETSGGNETEPAPAWEVVNIPAGKTVVGEIGCQILLRIGSAKCYSTGSVGLIDLTDGSTLGNGDSLKTNHLYLVTIQGRGFTNSSGKEATLLLKGDYKIQ